MVGNSELCEGWKVRSAGYEHYKDKQNSHFQFTRNNTNLSLATIFPSVSRCVSSSSSGGVASISAAGASGLASLWPQTQRLKVQCLVLERSLDIAEHPAVLHPRSRRVWAESRKERRAVVLRGAPPLRHPGEMWPDQKQAREEKEEEAARMKISDDKRTDRMWRRWRRKKGRKEVMGPK